MRSEGLKIPKDDDELLWTDRLELDLELNLLNVSQLLCPPHQCSSECSLQINSGSENRFSGPNLTTRN